MTITFLLHVKQPGNCDRTQVASGNHLRDLRIDPAAIENVALERRQPGMQLFVWILRVDSCFTAKTRSRNAPGYEDQRPDPMGTGNTVHGALQALHDKLLTAPHHQGTVEFVAHLLDVIPEPELDLANFRS